MSVVDLRGVLCPTNFVKTKLALEMADVGEVVKNVPRSLKAEGHKLPGLKEEDGGQYWRTVEKGAERG